MYDNSKGFAHLILLVFLLVAIIFGIGYYAYKNGRITSTPNQISTITATPALTSKLNNDSSSQETNITKKEEVVVYGPTTQTDNGFITLHLSQESNALAWATISVEIPTNVEMVVKKSSYPSGTSTETIYRYVPDNNYWAGLMFGPTGLGNSITTKTDETVYLNNKSFTKTKLYAGNRLMLILYHRDETFDKDATPMSWDAYLYIKDGVAVDNLNDKAVTTLEKLIGSVKVVDIKR